MCLESLFWKELLNQKAEALFLNKFGPPTLPGLSGPEVPDSLFRSFKAGLGALRGGQRQTRDWLSHPCALHTDNTCHFEDEKICGYTQDLTDNFDWTRQNALTQNPKRSPNTGPPTDISGTPEGEDVACP